jgi:hypothetical protein
MPRPRSTKTITPPKNSDRNPTLAPSRLKAMGICPGYVSGESGEAADEGSMLHAVVESMIGNHRPPAEYDPEVKEHREMVEYAMEVNRLLEDEARSADEAFLGWVELQIQIAYCNRQSRLDRVLKMPAARKAIVCDWKFGRNIVDAPDKNMQMRAYGVGLWMDDPTLESIDLILCYPRYKKMDRATFLLPDFKAALLDLARIAARSECWQEHLNPGEGCNWCGRKLSCPAVASNVATVFAAMGHDPASIDPASVDLKNPARLGHMREAAEVVSSWADDVKKFTNDVAINQGIDIPGYKICSKQGTQSLTDIHRALLALQKMMEKNGLGDLDYGMVLDHLKPSPSALSKYLVESFKAKNPKPPKGSIGQLEDSIEAEWESMKILHKNSEVFYLRKE